MIYPSKTVMYLIEKLLVITARYPLWVIAAGYPLFSILTPKKNYVSIMFIIITTLTHSYTNQYQ